MPHRDTVAGVLRLRSWALAVLTGSGVDEPPRVGTSSHLYFWEAERCATPLLSKLKSRGVVEGLPDHFRPKLLRRAREEAGRIGGIRQELETVAEIARRKGWKVAVLKGAVPLTVCNQPLDAVDLDLLVEPNIARDLAAELDRLGYRPTGHSNPRHLRARARDDGAAIEIHTTLDLSGAPASREIWDGWVPIPRMPGLWRLSAPEHLWHLLQHVTIDHPERCGLLRELLLLQGAAKACTLGELSEVRDRAGGDDEGRRVLDVLGAVERMEAGEATQPVVRAAARFYSVRSLLAAVPFPPQLEGYVYKWTFGWLFGRAARRHLWEEVWWKGLEPSTYSHVRRVERGVPWLGRTYRVLLRAFRSFVAGALALPAACVAAGVARDALQAQREPR